jgi:hypothetical protein
MPAVIVLVVVALYCAGQAVVALTQPATIAGVVGLDVTVPHARSEVMTFYGGFYAGMAALFALAVVRRTVREGALAFLALALTGAALARLWTVAVFPLGTLTAATLLVAEVVFAVLGWYGWWSHLRETNRATV